MAVSLKLSEGLSVVARESSGQPGRPSSRMSSLPGQQLGDAHTTRNSVNLSCGVASFL